MKQTIYFLTGFVAAGLGVFLVMLMLVGSVREEASELRGELDKARAEVVDLKADLPAVYCRGINDITYSGWGISPEQLEIADTDCIAIVEEGRLRPDFRGP